jgi:hypothetical protein
MPIVYQNMTLEKYICDLLYKHECVIVPEFGGFITNFEPASIQSTTHTILPPRKFLVFNSSLTINDGLLAAEISGKLNCSFDEAMQMIRLEVTAWHERLKAGKTIMLPGIGEFRINKAGKMEFIPDQEQNFFNEAFGLTGLVVPPLRKRVRKTRAPKAVYHRPARRSYAKTIRRLAWAAAITIPLVAASIWSIMNYDTLKHYAEQHSGIVSMFNAGKETVNDKTANIEAGSHSFADVKKDDVFEEDLVTDDLSEQDLVTPNEFETAGDEIAEGLPPASEEPAPQPKVISSRAYHIIIGSFENEINAQHLADELVSSGFEARMVPSGQGMFRVSIAAYTDKQEALQQLQKVREERNPNAWLLRI